MTRKRVDSSDLSDWERGAVQKLLEGLRRGGSHPIVHKVVEHSFRGEPRRELVALIEQERDRDRLLLWGCRLGAPPAHEAGASVYGDYDRVLSRLSSEDDWTEREKNAIRTFIDGRRRHSD